MWPMDKEAIVDNTTVLISVLEMKSRWASQVIMFQTNALNLLIDCEYF